MSYATPAVSAPRSSRIRSDAGRLLAVSLPLDVFFSCATALAFMKLLGTTPAQASGALLVGYLIKLVIVVAATIAITRPIARWRHAPAAARDALVSAAWLAADRTPGQLAIVWSSAWAAAYLVVAALLPAQLLAGRWGIVLLAAGGLAAGTLALAYTVIRTLLTRTAHEVSVDAGRRGLVLPPSRSRFRSRLAGTTLSVGIAPILWLGAVTLVPGRDATTVLLFSLVAMLWIPLAAWYQASVVAAALADISGGIARVTHDPTFAASVAGVPVRSRDELGELARGVNQMIARLAQTAASLRAREGERQRLVDDLDAKRRLLEAVLEHTPVGIALVEAPDFRIRFFNPAYQRLVPGRSLLDRPFAEVIPEAAEAAARDFADVLNTGSHRSVADAVFHMRRADGTIFDQYVTRDIVPVYAEAQLKTLLLVIEDTTERVRARRRIEELATVAERRASELQAVLDNMVDAVLVCDAAGRATLANRAALRLLGTERVANVNLEAVAAHLVITDDLTGRTLTASDRPLRRALLGETTASRALTLRRPGRLPRDLRVSAAPIRDALGRVVAAVAVLRDVTELADFDRLKDQFVRAAAHELKTPVTIMKTRSQTLLRAPELDEPRRKALEAIDRGADRIAFIVRDLLELSEASVGRLRFVPQPTDLVRLVDGAIERAATLSRRHRVRRSGAASLRVEVDASRISGVVDRLLHNAIKHSPAGGDIEISVQPEPGAVVVAVRDQGIGIPAAAQPRLFERFYRAHADTASDFGGLGVGLFIARHIVELHGGSMGFQSQEGLGSTFWFRLPLSQPAVRS